VTEIFALLTVAALVWFWQDSQRAREHALAACRRACRQFNAQLLDETVFLSRLRLARNAAGRLAISRRYDFEFSLSGEERRRGWVICIGPRIHQLTLEHPEGRTLVSPPRG
jgi:hypothetical protein